MSEQNAEVKTLTGTAGQPEERNGYQGRKGYRVPMTVIRDGKKSTLQLDILMPQGDPNGACPFQEGKEYTFDYTRKDYVKTDPESGETSTTYFYNYRWPSRGGGGWKGGGGSYGPRIVLKGSDLGAPGERTFSVDLTCNPSDDLKAMAEKVNGSLNWLKETVGAKPVATATAAAPTKAAAPARPEKIEDDCPF